MPRLKTALLAAASALAGLLATSAQAGDWVVTVGVRDALTPPYEGAGSEVDRIWPTLSLRRADRPYRFVPPDGGTTLAIIDTEHFVLGPMARFQYQREPQGDLVGLKKIDYAVEPGAFAEVWPLRWVRLRGELRHGVTGHNGLVGDAGLDLVYTGRKWDASLGGRIGWGDNAYMDKYFGVSPQEAARSPIINQAYNPDGGRRYAGVELAGAYHLTNRWKITADAGYHRLAPTPADSPIVKLVGQDDQYTVGIGVSYSFSLHL